MKKYSIVKFGSQLNANFDEYSDKDLLICTETNKELKELFKLYSAAGWSVSGYTYSKLKYLSNKGSLFLSHLQLNSTITYDFNNRVSNIICSHQPKDNYFTELDDARKYFNIINFTPDLQLGYAWFADCFYVGLRNYLIFEYANKNIFEFSYLNIIELLLIENRISKEEYSVLRQLRVVKFNYRENILDELPSKSFIESLFSIASKLNFIKEPSFQNPKNFQINTLKNVYSNEFNGYQKLRLIEGIYCSKEVNIPEIKRIVSNPQFYASKLLDNSFLNKILNKLEKKDAAGFINLAEQRRKKECFV